MTMTGRANESTPASRHPPLASAMRRDCLFIGLACRAQRGVPVAERRH
jgi:hypothetical protein